MRLEANAFQDSAC